MVLGGLHRKERTGPGIFDIYKTKKNGMFETDRHGRPKLSKKGKRIKKENMFGFR